MSVLHKRIVAQGTSGPEYVHPAATGATPMTMPLAVVTYDPAGLQYDDLHAMPAAGDPNAVPLAVLAPGRFGKVIPAGRP